MLTPESRTIEMIRGRYDPITDTGYMGYVSAHEFISGDQLVDQLNFRNGTDENSDAGWLKFYVGSIAKCNATNKQKILYIAKKIIKHSVSWDEINCIGLVYGNTSIDILGQSYSVRLMTGGETNSCVGSEWDELLCRVHVGQSDCNFNWEMFDPELDTNITSVHGRFAWCQETPPTKPTERVFRGFFGLGFWNTAIYCESNAYSGWRPVLELVQ